MLMATALLISGQAKAAVIEVNGSTETLKKAFDRAETGDEIKLTASLNGMGGICRLYDGRDITINLNGNNINVPNNDLFMIYKGHLTFSGQGVITFANSYYSGTRGSCEVDGVTYSGGIPYMFVTLYGHNDPSTPVGYSWFTLGENVTLQCDGTPKGGKTFDYQYPIAVSMFGNWPNDYRDALNGELGYKSPNSACGVRVDVSGKVIATGFGISVNGTNKEKNGNVPEIYIYETASVICKNPGDADNASIYGAGYAKWFIYGYVAGGVGIYAKAGQITLNGATVESNENSWKQSTNESSGQNGHGSAIVLDSNEGYAGNMSLTVQGETTITSTAGYAIDEIKTNAVATKTDAIIIKSGTITGGTKGCLNTTAEVKENVKVNGTITGGTFSDETIKEYISNVDGVIEVQAGDETKYVVNGMPQGKTWVSTIAEAGATDYVKIAENEEVSSDAEIAYLNIPGANKVTVKSGAKLSVGEAVLGEDAIIEVEAGARLVVNGTNGLIAFETTNLVLKAAADQPTGMFVLNPDVKANKQPWATLEYVSKAFSLEEGDYMWEMFTNPFAFIATADREPNQPSIFQHVVNGQFENFGAWGTDGDVRSAAPFELIAVTNTSDQTTNVKYTFTGQLQGSNDAAFSLNAGFNYLGNGYTALMNAKQVIAALQQSSENVRTLLYVWEFGKQGWTCYNGYKLNELNDVNPLTAFVLYADEAAEVNMDYEKLIWNVNK